MSTWVIITAVLLVFLALMVYDRLSPRFQTTERLRAYLRQSDPLYFGNALKELKRRGEEIKEEIVPILHLVISDSKQHRIIGWLIMREVYPELADQVASFNPHDDVEVCKQKMQGIFLSAQLCAAPNGGPVTQLANSGITEGPPSVS